MTVLFTISGLPGTGTTTLANTLAERLNATVVSAGEIFRQQAAASGLSLEDYGRRADADPAIDQALDALMVETAKNHDRCIAEGRLTGALVPDADVRILLYAPADVRAARVQKRSDECLEKMVVRETNEAARYMALYGVNPCDTRLYDLCLNTARFSAHDCVAIAHTARLHELTERNRRPE